MTILTLSASGRLTPDEAWERYADLAQWTHWAPQIKRVEATGERLAFGVTGRVYGPAGVFVDFVVEAVDRPGRRWSWTVRRWPITLRLEHTVRKQGGGSATTLRIDGPLPVVLGYAPMAQFALYRLVSKQPRPEVDSTTIPDMYVDPTDPAQVAAAAGDGSGDVSSEPASTDATPPG